MWTLAARRSRTAGSSQPATTACSTASAALDTKGNVWTSAGDGVHCYHPDGTLLGKITIPEVVANVTFGGPKRNRLFICGTTSLYSVFVNAKGATWPDRA